MIKSVNLALNLVRITQGVSYLQSNSFFKKIFVSDTGGYKEGHRDRVPRQLTMFLSTIPSQMDVARNKRGGGERRAISN